MFLYFVPSGGEVPKSLDYAFERQPNTREIVADGPGGQSGKLLFGPEWADFAQLAGFDSDSQVWQQSESGDYWLGYRKDLRPTPRTLKRSKQLPGQMVRLEDGNDWLIPVARGVNEALQGTCRLPQRFERRDGQWVPGDVVDKFTRLWQITQEWWNVLSPMIFGGSGDFVIQLDDEASWCVEILATNYRVGVDEVSMLGLLSDEAATGILTALVDFDAIKKKMDTQLS